MNLLIQLPNGTTIITETLNIGSSMGLIGGGDFVEGATLPTLNNHILYLFIRNILEENCRAIAARVI